MTRMLFLPHVLKEDGLPKICHIGRRMEENEEDLQIRQNIF
jgi:hypothetical protein